MVRATANILVGTLVVVTGLIASAFGIAGIVNLGAAHAVLLAAWIAAVGGVCTAEILASKPKKHTLVLGLTTAVVSGIVLYQIDFWMLKKKLQQEANAQISTPVRGNKDGSTEVNIAADLAEGRRNSNSNSGAGPDPLLRWVTTKNGKHAVCLTTPQKPALNSLPVTYQSPAEFCHDYPLVDARPATEEGQYSRSQEEYETGVTAHAGDEIYILIYINNGAPNAGVDRVLVLARNVTLTLQTDTEPGATHNIKVMATGDNVESIYGVKKINTAPNERLEVIPNSGQVRNFTADKILGQRFSIGNGVVKIGDLGPDFSDALFIRYSVKVIS